MEKLQLYVPKLDDLWFRQEMMADPATMSYNAHWDVAYAGYHPDTGCIDFPEDAWADWYDQWIGQEPEYFYAYIVRCSDGAWLGEVCFHHTPEQDWWDMGIVLYAPYRRKGYAVPALRLMLDRAFRDGGVTRLHNEFELTRPAALEIHRTVGFREVGSENGIRHVMLTREEYLKESGMV